MKISNVEPLKINKITDLIEPRTLELILKGLSEEGATLVVEEKDGEKIERVPTPKKIVEKYWTELCRYIDKFQFCKHECVTDTQKRAREIIEKNILEPEIRPCHLGLSIICIPFVFKGRVIGVLFGGKKKVIGSDGIAKGIEDFIETHKSEIEKEGFDCNKALELVSSIPEITKEEFEEEKKRLEEATDYIVKIGLDNYNAIRRFRNQQFLSDIMRYFISQYQIGKKPLRETLKIIFDEINSFAKTKQTVFIWRHEKIAESKEYTIISSPQLFEEPLPIFVIEKLPDFKRFIENEFERRDGVYCCHKTFSNGFRALSMVKTFLGITVSHSIYVRFITFNDGSEGTFFFADPEEEGFSEDCVEFLNLVVERLESQIDIYLTDEAKGDFMAEASHRLKSPMQGIWSNIWALESHCEEKGLKDEEITVFMQEIIAGIRDIDSQTKNYLFITTLDKEEHEYDFDHHHPIVKRVEECVGRFRSVAKERDIELKDVEVVGNKRRIIFDWNTIGIALDNLLDNAVKFSHFDTFILTKIFFNDYKKACTISITNRGSGIAPDETEEIFKRYYRGKIFKDQIRFIPGTGVGLAVVNEIIKKHGGERDVRSEHLYDAQKGDVYLTTFTISLPYLQKEEK
ncbi:MAG: ATP-binding protein [Nitrospirota bacterium]